MKTTVNTQEFWFNIIKGAGMIAIFSAITYSFASMPYEFRKGFGPHVEEEITSTQEMIMNQTYRINELEERIDLLSEVLMRKDNNNN